jgi:hypothetical protein
MGVVTQAAEEAVASTEAQKSRILGLEGAAAELRADLTEQGRSTDQRCGGRRRGTSRRPGAQADVPRCWQVRGRGDADDAADAAPDGAGPGEGAASRAVREPPDASAAARSNDSERLYCVSILLPLV